MHSFLSMSAEPIWKQKELPFRSIWTKLCLIFLKLPPGCGEFPGKFFGPGHTIYRLGQSSRAWSMYLTSGLKKLGFQEYLVDPCVLRLMDVGQEVKMIAGVHIDMIMVAATRIASGFTPGHSSAILGFYRHWWASWGNGGPPQNAVIIPLQRMRRHSVRETWVALERVIRL